MKKRLYTPACTKEEFTEDFGREVHEGYPILWQLQRPADMEKGSICGHMEDGRFVLFQDVGSRSLKPLFYEVLSGRFTPDGHIEYRFRKAWFITWYVCFLIFMSGVLLWATLPHVPAGVWCVVALAVFFVAVYFIPSRKNRKTLLRTMETLCIRPKRRIGE